jgi:hypothetical protein
VASRLDAERAIQKWRKRLGLRQTDLANRAKVKPATLSHILHEPGWTASAAVYGRICEVVESEVGTRISSVPMKVMALCHDETSTLDEPTEAAIIKSVRAALGQSRPSSPLVLPPGVKGALVQLGPRGSGIYLVVVLPMSDSEERVAIAHELEHLRMELLDGVEEPFTAPRSSF